MTRRYKGGFLPAIFSGIHHLSKKITGSTSTSSASATPVSATPVSATPVSATPVSATPVSAPAPVSTPPSTAMGGKSKKYRKGGYRHKGGYHVSNLVKHAAPYTQKTAGPQVMLGGKSRKHRKGKKSPSHRQNHGRKRKTRKKSNMFFFF
jgi:hypothetical protein